MSCILLAIHIAFFYKIGVFNDFVFWVVFLPFFKASSIPGYVALPTIKQLLIVLLPLILVIFLAKSSQKREYFLILSTLPLLFFAYPRFDYFHLVAYLGAVAVALGVQLRLPKASELKKMYIPTGIVLIVLVIFSIHYFRKNWRAETRFFEPDIQSAAYLLKIVTSPEDRVYIQNGPDQLLPLSGRLPIKPWAIQFPWYFEIGDLQARTVSALESQKPQFIVYKPYEGKEEYSLGSYKPSTLAAYLDANYVNQIQISDSLWLKSKN